MNKKLAQLLASKGSITPEDLANILGEEQASRFKRQAIGFAATLGSLIGMNSADINSFSTIGGFNPTKASAMGSEILAANKAAQAEVTNEFNSAMTDYGNKVIGQQVSGLAARGITDKGVTAETTAQLGSSISAARAAAANALEQAKLNSSGVMARAMSNYYTGMSDLQYQSMIKEYTAKQGIVGALNAGIGSAIGAGVADTLDTGLPTPNPSETTSAVEENKAPSLTPDDTQSYTYKLLKDVKTPKSPVEEHIAGMFGEE